MFVELLMKKNGKIIFGLFLVITVIATIFGGVLVYNSLNTDIYQFSKDGYALSFNGEKNTKAVAYSFKNGTEYQFKKNSNTINFKVAEEKVRLDENTVIHYSDDSLGVLKKVVGIDLSTVDRKIIFYYNIYKDTKITASNEGYGIKLANEQEVTFKNLLMRISDTKFILTGKNVRLVLSAEEIIDFGEYVEFEYMDGNVVKIYNQDKYYQTISSESTLLVDDIKIKLSEAIISKGSKDYISLTNLVIDNDGNIDALEEEIYKEQLSVNEGDVELPSIEVPDTSTEEENSKPEDSGTAGDDEQTEEVEDPDKIKKTPDFKIVELLVTSLKLDARVEISDPDNLITSDTKVTVVENKTGKVVYEEIGPMGDAQIYLSTADLKPDTEYTIYAQATYVMDGTEIERIFVSKIFRTEDLGVSFETSYLTTNSISVEITKEVYSKVQSFVLELYDSEGRNVNYYTISLSDSGRQEVKFEGLRSNTTYSVKMTEILCQGVIVDEGFAQSKNVTTLKSKPSIGDLTYEIDKRQSLFNLNVEALEDHDYGIQKYRYEIYDARDEVVGTPPVLTISTTDLATQSIKVDDIKIHRGIPYTYVLVAEFYDNEKTVEYSKELGTTMTLDGVQFPTVRWDTESSYVTWEQINGTIIIDDPSNAIVSTEYQIVYRNSIDVYTSTKITADSATGNIPININGLRANETYTFQVYATINLQDGNDTESSVYIGSVYVQTKKPQSLRASFTPTNDYSNAFSFEFMLSSLEEQDASLEASTLSEITFTVYKGATVEGAKQVYKRVVDYNELPYESTLKLNYFDDSTIIDPEFFNTKNTDYYEDVYTLEVSQAYDYTDYKNEIPIENNTYSFKLSSYLPEIPEDVNDAAIVNTITNNVAESFEIPRNKELNGNITVAYGLLPKYNNETKTAKYIKWKAYVLNHQTKEYEEVPGFEKTVNFDSNGDLDYVIYELSNGTSQDVVDKDQLRRGNTYYFTYNIYLDINNDGTIDNVYPESVDPTVTLRSKELTPLKQQATIDMYPSSSEETSYTWNYKIKDIDNALEENKLYSFTEGSTQPTSAPAISTNEDYYSKTTFTGLTGGKVIQIKKQERLYKQGEAEYTLLNQQYFYKLNNTLNLEYAVKAETNKVVISIKNYQANMDVINTISAVDVVVYPKDEELRESLGTTTIAGLKLDNDTISLDYFALSKYQSVEIVVDLVAYYDSGRMGFDLESKYVALQKVSTQPANNYYIYDVDSKKIYQNTIITNSIYSKTLDIEAENLRLTTPAGNKVDFAITVDSTGIMYDDTNIVLKELATKKLNSSNKEVIFDGIIPGISLLNSSKRIDITALLDSALITAKLVTLPSIKIEADTIYIELYETDENGTNAKFVETVAKHVDVFSTPFTIDGLTPNKNYYIKFYANIYDNQLGKYEKQYLYDIDQLTTGCTYNFYTLAEVKVSNINVQLIENSYTDKKLQLTYNLDVVYGYDRIEYKIQKKTSSGYVDTDIKFPTSTAFFTGMNLSISASPGLLKDLTYGGEYKIIITPIGSYTDADGETQEMVLGTVSQNFTIEYCQQPYVGVTMGKDASSIYFRVSISDPDYIIYNGTYDVKLLNENYEVITTITDQSINVKNKRFTFSNLNYNLVDGEKYYFIVTLKLDNENRAANLTNKTTEKSITFGDELNIGTVTTAQNANDSFAIDIIFQDSYKLNTVDTIQYTISNADTGFYYSNKAIFNIRYDSAKDLYYYTITITDTENYIDNNMYIIGINFYEGNRLVGQEEITYYYTL